jgi:autotransporter-associated beta strand protein
VPQAGGTNTTVNVDGVSVTGTATNGYVGVSGIGSGAHDIAYVIVIPPPLVGFSGGPTNGAAPLTVTFTNLSSNATNYVWNFGDGNTFSTSSSINVTDTYTNVGSYTVSLMATGPAGTNSLTNTAYIVVINPPPVQIITNADNGGNLTVGASWIGGVAPGWSDVAVFDSTITSGHPAYATNVLGADTTWGEIQILNPALPVQISAGNTLTLNGLNSLGVDMSRAANALTLNCPVALGASQTWLVVSGQTLNVNGAVSGAGLTINNGSTANGTVILGAANTYTGGTLINGGVVQMQNAASLGTGTIINNGGTISLTATAVTIGNNLWFTGTSIMDDNNYLGNNNFNGTFGGNGTVIITNLATATPSTAYATFTLNGSMANFTGKIIIAPGTSAGNPINGFLRFNSSGTVNNTGSTNASFNLGASPSLAILCTRNAETANLGELTGGPGTAVEGPRNAGTTIWSIGGLNTSTTFAGSIIDKDPTETATGLIAALTKVGTGTLTLTGTNTYSGATTISGGVLQIGSGGALGTLGTNAVTVAGGTTLTFDRSDNYTMSNNISGAGNLVIMGRGTDNYTGNDTGTGSTIVSNATLLVSGIIGNGQVNILNGGTLGGGGIIGGTVTNQSGGTVQPGAGASTAGTVLTISNLTLLSGGTTIMKVSHNDHTNDQVASSGIGYGGILTVTTNAGDAPLNFGDSFKLFNAGAFTGSFITTNLPSLSSGLAWSNCLAINGSVNVVQAPPVANFTGTPTNLFVTQTVTFTDGSTGSITNWVWSFGDGQTVTDTSNASVIHAYAAAGTDTVSLIVSGAGGSSTNTLANYVAVKPKAVLGGVTLKADGNLVFSGTNGPAGAQYRILTATDVSLPSANWTPVWTNVFAADGSYSYTNTPGAGASSFFLLVSP